MAKSEPRGNARRQTAALSDDAKKTGFTLGSLPLALVLVVVTFAAYQSVWHAGFIWDDDDHLTANPAMTAPDGLRMIWSSLAESRYYPLTLTTFWFQRQLWGLNPMPYHLVNIALHALNGVLLFLVLRRLRIRAAWLAAMLWVLHPVNVESVAWITELKNTQSGGFFFLSLLCFLRFEADKKPRWYALALVCGLAALLSKPSTVVLPIALLLCAWWERGRWEGADIIRTAPFFGLAAGMSVLTVIEQGHHVSGIGTADWNLGIAERLVIAAKAVWFYAAKLLWPVRLSFIYPRWEVSTRSVLSWMPFVGLVAVGALVWAWRRQPWARACLFGTGFFVAALLPVLGFFDVYFFRFSFVADHFQYLASAGLLALIASAGTGICERNGRLGGQIAAVVVPATLMALGILTWRQGRVYRDSETLWQDTIAKNPSCWMAHSNLGILLREDGKLPEAIRHYEQALQVKPDYAEAHCNLGNAFSQTGRFQDAIAHYQRALQIRPDYVEAHNNLAFALLRTGKVEDAIAHLEQVVRLSPNSAEGQYNLANALSQVGRVQDAMGHYEQAVRLKPGFAEAYNGLGVLLDRKGQTQAAISEYLQALRLQPDYAEALNNLGLALASQGKLDEAIADIEAALRLNPDYAEAHYALAILLAKRGKIDDAISQLQSALKLEPNSEKYRRAFETFQRLITQPGIR